MRSQVSLSGDLCQVWDQILRYVKTTCQLKNQSILFGSLFEIVLQQCTFQKELTYKKVQKKHVNKMIKCI